LAQNSIEIWNGGMPDVYLVSPEGGECLHVWRSRHLPLGILDDSGFSTETDYWVYDQDVQIVLCSDGLLEAENREGDAFGYDGLMAIVREEDCFEQRMEMISDALLMHLDGLPPADDVSLLVIHPRFQKISTELSSSGDWMLAADPQSDFSPWEFYLYLTADQLRRIEAVPLVHQILKDIEPPSARASELFVVLSELLCNAVDHGILGIDSEIKEMEDGMEAFYQERAERLKLLKHGYLGIRLEKILGESGSVLMIRVSCSGQGFDYRAVVAKAKEASMEALFRPYGRGIPLLLRLCESLEYSDQGREALAVFQL
jgi:anti-sigma regulatory factor (Ser/Thr protein kinase)